MPRRFGAEIPLLSSEKARLSRLRLMTADRGRPRFGHSAITSERLFSWSSAVHAGVSQMMNWPH